MRLQQHEENMGVFFGMLWMWPSYYNQPYHSINKKMRDSGFVKKFPKWKERDEKNIFQGGMKRQMGTCIWENT